MNPTRTHVVTAIGGCLGTLAIAVPWLLVSPDTWSSLGWMVAVLGAGLGMSLAKSLSGQPI